MENTTRATDPACQFSNLTDKGFSKLQASFTDLQDKCGGKVVGNKVRCFQGPFKGFCRILCFTADLDASNNCLGSRLPRLVDTLRPSDYTFMFDQCHEKTTRNSDG